MALPPKIRVLLTALLLTVAGLAFGVQPKLVPFERIPGEFNYCLGIVKYGSTWVAVSQDSLLWGFGTELTPTQLRPPNGGELRTAAAHPRGMVVAGVGFCFIYSGGQWTSLNLDDHFWSSLSVAQGVLLVGLKDVYFVDAAGVAKKVLPVQSGLAPRVFAFNGTAYLFSRDGGGKAYRWNGAALEAATEELPWAQGYSISSVQPLPDGKLLVCSSRTIRIVAGSEVTTVVQLPVSPGSQVQFAHASLYGDIVVAVTYSHGIRAYSRSTRELLWQIPAEDLAGNVHSVSAQDEGLVIGTAHGVFLLPDPSRFVFQGLPPGDERFVMRLGGRLTVGLTTGVYDFQTGALVLPQAVTSLIELSPGRLIEGRMGAVVFEDKEVRIGGSEVQQMALIDENTVIAMQPSALSLVTRDGSITRLSLASTVSSIAGINGNEVLAGTGRGAMVITSSGSVRSTFGTGMTRVIRFRKGALAFDSTGAVFNENGRLLGHSPTGAVWDVADLQGRTYVLFRNEKGERWVAQLDLDTFTWHPLDLPLYPAPSGITTDEGRLVVIAPRMSLTVTDPQPLSAPDTRSVSLSARFRPAAAAGPRTLPADEDAVEVRLPVPRLFPWRNPTYTIQLNGAAFETAQPGATVTVPRLPWGGSHLTIRSEWSGISSSLVFDLHRERPWWMRSPAMVLYLGLAALAGYGAVRWRTAHLLHRAQLLQAMVDERTAELRKAQKAREDFFSTLSHEIRNPLNGVVGICEILEEAAPSSIAPRERVFVRTLRGCADQLRSILDDVLDFARIDRGAIQVHEEPFDLVASIEGAVRASDAELSRCTLRLPEGPIWLRGDVGKVRQIVTNLTSNALKYGIPSQAKIQVAVAEKSPGSKTARISVINTGPTIPAEELDAIFSGFVRGQDAVKRHIAGTGIGLAVSRRMAEALGGTLTATSADGLTEFRLELQFATSAAPVEVESISPFETNSRALAIEDEQYNRLVLGHILSRMGYEVDWATDGATAMERVRSSSYDLILTDFVLPDTNGIELAKRMLAELKEPKPPIVAVTAYSTPEKIQQAREAGIVGFVTKPISKKKLESAILGVGPKLRIRQAIDVEPSENCDFSSLLRLPNGRQVLAQYADELPDAWSKLASALSHPGWQENAGLLARNVHAFRSRILAVHAMDAAEQLSLLEEAVRNQQQDTVERVVAVLSPVMVDITEAARHRATATA